VAFMDNFKKPEDRVVILDDGFIFDGISYAYSDIEHLTLRYIKKESYINALHAHDTNTVNLAINLYGVEKPLRLVRMAVTGTFFYHPKETSKKLTGILGIYSALSNGSLRFRLARLYKQLDELGYFKHGLMKITANGGRIFPDGTVTPGINEYDVRKIGPNIMLFEKGTYDKMANNIGRGLFGRLALSPVCTFNCDVDGDCFLWFLMQNCKLTF